MLPDSLTDTVFLSEWLPSECPTLYQNLEKVFKECVGDIINKKKDIFGCYHRFDNRNENNK